MEKLIAELKMAYGENAEFREGQQEAIEAILEKKRLLVVQKTGWGKSLVYFLATKILRKTGRGITFIISPLLALMKNQIDSANRLGLNVVAMNSENKEEWEAIIEELKLDKVDALIISPERLANEDFRQMLSQWLAAKISLFVVDEAHCISDWGHDFRPDYRRIVDIINILPSNIPVLATTATANNRVVNDIKQQLGEDLIISRGSLMRDTLALQVIHLPSREERLAWLLQNINLMPGTGIIYCLTINDCKLVNKWLKSNGIASECFYSELEKEKKDEAISSFMSNSIKALVATVAFGMGFDKADISFVIHFQKPGNLVAYYQQIGRAGRGIDQAYAIMLCGSEDEEINNYFIDSAFPTEVLMDEVIRTVSQYPGIGITELEKYINMKAIKIKQCVTYLAVNGDIYSENKRYYKSPRMWKPNIEKSDKITRIRRNELLQVEEFSKLRSCYMYYIASVLDDVDAKICGKCANCLSEDLFSSQLEEVAIYNAQRFIREDFSVIEPRKKWPSGITVDGRNKIPDDMLNKQGRVLSNYGDAGWGKLVSKGKYEDEYFDDELVEASFSLLKDFVEENDIKWIASVPSTRRPQLVKSFAERLAEKLKVPYFDVIRKNTGGRYQKELNTSYLQYENVNESMEVERAYLGNVLLVDDMVDSKWTFTVCGYKLRKCGSGEVYPFALANSAGKNGE